MFRRYLACVLNHPWIAMVLVAGVAGLLISGGSRVSFNSDYRIFFQKDNPDLVAFEQLERTFSKEDNVFFVVSPERGGIFTREALAAIGKLTELGWRIPYAQRVSSITNFPHSTANGDELIVRDLVPNPAAPGDDEIRTAREVALAEPVLVRYLIAPSGNVAGVDVTLHPPDSNAETVRRQVVESARAIQKEVESSHPGVKIRIFGLTPFNNAFAEAREHDSKTLVLLSFLIMLLIAWLLLRKLAAVLATVIVVVASIGSAMGAAGWLGIETSLATMSAPLIILTLGVAHSVHILLSFFDAARTGLGRREALAESLTANVRPVLMTTLATATGFLCLNFSDVPPFRNLGNIVAIGEIATGLYSLCLLPALIAVLPMRLPQATATDRTGALMSALARWVVRRRKAVLMAVAAVATAFLAAIPLNELNDVFVDYFSPSTQIRQDAEYLRENLTGLDAIHYPLAAGPDGVVDPEFLRLADSFANWYRTQPDVVHVLSFTDVMKRLNRNMHGDDPAWYRLPEQRDLAAQYLLLYELSLPQGMDLASQISHDRSSARMIVLFDKMSTRKILEIERRAQEWLMQNAPAIQAPGTGTSLMFANMSLRNVKSMLWGSLASLLIISVLLVAMLRSVRIGLLSLVPNLVPTGIALGLWGLLHGRINVALAISMSVTLGIVVDDTIHMLSKYLHARRERGLGPEDSIGYAFAHVGKAMLTTSIILIAGFLVLALSSYAPNVQLGLFIAMTFAAALVCDFLLLPPLLLAFDRIVVAPAVDAALEPAVAVSK